MVLATILAIAASGCSVAGPVNNYHPVRQAIDFPNPGEVIEVANGKEMIRHGQVTMVRGIRLIEPTTIGSFTLSDGFYPQFGEDEANTYHGYRMVAGDNGDLGVIEHAEGGTRRWAAAPDAIRATRDGSRLCLIFADKGRKACRDGLPMRKIAHYGLGNRDLQQKLIFDGASADKVRLIYWENSGHFARPELAKQIEFTGPFPRTIEYKGALLRIESADTDSIRFVMLRNFPSLWTEPTPQFSSAAD